MGGLGGFTGGAFGGFFPNFFRVLLSLINFRVSVLTEGDVAPIVGVLTFVAFDYITLSIAGGSVVYIPICQITLIQRVFE